MLNIPISQHINNETLICWTGHLAVLTTQLQHHTAAFPGYWREDPCGPPVRAARHENRKHVGGRSARGAGRHACTDLHALPSQGCLQQLCWILINCICIGEALVPLDQGAMVHTGLSQREAEAEADHRHAARLWPASLHTDFGVLRLHATVLNGC